MLRRGYPWFTLLAVGVFALGCGARSSLDARAGGGVVGESGGSGGAGGTTSEPRCGNGNPEPHEECDDGDLIPADGCETDCTRSRVTSVVVGDLRTCVLTSRGAVRCWGRNEHGAAGYGNGLCEPIPTPCTDECCVGDDETPSSVGQLVDVGGTAVQL